MTLQSTLVILTLLTLNSAYLKEKIWSLFYVILITGNKILWKRGEIAPLFYNIFNMSLTIGVKLHIHFLNVVRFIFSLVLQIWYVEVRISRSISESLRLRDNES